MSQETATIASLDAAGSYLARGWAPIPIPKGEKAPRLKGWQKLALGEDDLPRHFASGPNVGLLLGEPSNGLTDVDVDATEARALASQFLPPTDRTSGHASAPVSHFWYCLNPAARTEKYQAPDGTMLVELRSTGCQTVVAPSIHPEGEEYRWESEGDPATVGYADLRRSIIHLAIAALLARHWPAKGSRHQCAMAAAGTMLRAGMNAATATAIIEAAARVGGDEECRDRGRAVEDTRRALASGDRATGKPTLAKLVGDDIAAKIKEWLRLICRPMPVLSRTESDGAATGTVDHTADRTTLIENIRFVRDNRGDKGGIKEYDANRQVADLVFKYLSKVGRFISANHRGFFFDNRNHRLLAIEKDGVAWNGLLTLELDVNPADKERKFVHEYLQAHAIQNGEPSEIHVFSHYDRVARRLYVSIGDGRLVRMDGEKIELLNNGTDGALFLDPPDFTPFIPDYNAPQDMSIEHLIRSTNFERGDDCRLQPQHQRIVFRIWLFSIFFKSILPTRPVLCMVGEKGSGKTTLLRLVMRMLFGEGEQVILLPEKQDDLIPKMSSQYLMTIDNLDTPVKWIYDLLAVNATGGKCTKRVLFTTNQEIDLPMRSFLTITTRTPRFRRDDVSDRLLLLNVARREEFVPEGELRTLVERERPRMMGQLFTKLNKIVAVLKATEKLPTSRFRLADWAGLGMVIAAGSSEAETWTRLFTEALEGMADLQDAFTLNGDPLVDLFDAFAKTPQNLGCQWTCKRLFDQLQSYAQQLNLEFPYNNARHLGQRLTQVITALSRVLSLKFTTRKGAGGSNVYWITKVQAQEVAA